MTRSPQPLRRQGRAARETRQPPPGRPERDVRPQGAARRDRNFDGTAVVWDAASGRPLRTFAAHTGTVEGVAFSPDGTLLATAGEDTTAKLWDLRTGKEVLTLTGHTFALTDVAFSPDGTRLATSSGDGTVRVYVLPLDQLMTVARSRLTRGWTPDECKRYLPGRSCPRNP